MNDIHLSNSSQPSEEQPTRAEYQYYDWKVFVDEDAQVLESIDHVTYFLHPTFPNPVRTINDPSTGFALETSGWGEFEIRARVQYKDGSTESTSYKLDLSKG